MLFQDSNGVKKNMIAFITKYLYEKKPFYDI